MEMLGGLVISQVGIHSGGPETGHEIPSDHLRRPHQFQQQLVVHLFQSQERFNVLFGEEDDVIFPERVGVVKGEDPIVLEIDRDNLKAGQDIAAIEITDRFTHCLYFPLLPLFFMLNVLQKLITRNESLSQLRMLILC
jgi:hypothetical protein